MKECKLPIFVQNEICSEVQHLQSVFQRNNNKNRSIKNSWRHSASLKFLASMTSFVGGEIRSGNIFTKNKYSITLLMFEQFTVWRHRWWACLDPGSFCLQGRGHRPTRLRSRTTSARHSSRSTCVRALTSSRVACWTARMTSLCLDVVTSRVTCWSRDAASSSRAAVSSLATLWMKNIFLGLGLLKLI